MNPRCTEKDIMPDDNKMMGCMCPPIYECPQERICERYIIHEVPQV